MHTARILLGATLALVLSAPGGVVAQESSGSPATFTDRFPAEPLPTQTPPEATRTQTPAEATRRQNPPEAARAQAPVEVTGRTKPQVVSGPVRAARVARPQPRARVVVVQRSYLDAGTEVQPGERHFLDYAFPPLHQPYNVVTNIGGRVGWHNSPLPGPLFPSTN
jgi:hypothetical protein